MGVKYYGVTFKEKHLLLICLNCCYFRLVLRFHDNTTRLVERCALIPASLLTPGDRVTYRDVEGVYQPGIIVEYVREEDAFYVAHADGNVNL